MRSRTSSDGKPRRVSGRSLGGPGSSSAPGGGIQKEVSVVVEESQDAAPSAGAKGNWTSTWASKSVTSGSMDAARRTEYFVDHVHQDGYRNA